MFRVQCDGPCKGWLSLREGYGPGTDVCDLVTEPTAVRAGLWSGERAARTAAQADGWYVSSVQGGVRALCPACKLNPLGITLPKLSLRDTAYVRELIERQSEPEVTDQ